MCGDLNFYHMVTPFASLNEELQLHLISLGAQRQPVQDLGRDQAITGLGVGEGGADQPRYGLDA